MQYSTIFTDEGTKVGGAVGAAEKTTDGEKREGGGGRGRGVGKGETWTFTTAQYWYSDSVFLRSLPLNLLPRVRSLSRVLALFLPLSRRKLLDNCYLHFYPIEENI